MGKSSGARLLSEVAQMVRDVDARRAAQKAAEKRKKQAQAFDEAAMPDVGLGPTPERARADEWDRGGTEKGQVSRKGTLIMRSRIARMQRDGWIDNEQAAALAAYEQLMEQAGYGNGRSCLDMTPKGGEAGTARIDARRKLASLRGEFTMNDTIGALLTVDAILWPDPSHGPQTVTQVAVRLFPGRESVAMKQARRMVEIVGTQLAESMGIARVRRLQVVRAVA